ncbi:hypothetical protein CCHR01_03927 [Colletotrichum chrysophilum]|uniref:Uncharacterized protein n=1 Tax=Colletotrichum chrysophilum TaxID=1836956 RepID=A0AAD9ARV6_9PEZI|nr:hypothetical protein CCHR01_03927 [Colletotrichum chrysophilum]
MAIKCPNGPHIPTEEDLEKQNLFKVTCSECHERVVRMAQIFSKTCPNSDSGYGPLTYGIVRDMAAGIRLGGCNLDIANMMTYQWKMAQLADRAVKNFGLPAPSNENCIMWDFGSIDIACQTRSQNRTRLGAFNNWPTKNSCNPEYLGHSLIVPRDTILDASLNIYRQQLLTRACQ